MTFFLTMHYVPGASDTEGAIYVCVCVYPCVCVCVCVYSSCPKWFRLCQRVKFSAFPGCEVARWPCDAISWVQLNCWTWPGTAEMYAIHHKMDWGRKFTCAFTNSTSLLHDSKWIEASKSNTLFFFAKTKLITLSSHLHDKTGFDPHWSRLGW